MTKRFKKRQHYLSWTIKDTVTWEQLNIDETINLLNNIYEENIKLKQENKMLRVTIGRNEAYIGRLTHQSEWSNEAKEMYPLKEEGKQYRS